MCPVHLSTIIVVTDADGALAAKTLGPESVEVHVGLRHVGVGEEEPQAEDWLGEDVEDGVGNDLGINAGNAGAVGNTPDTFVALAQALCFENTKTLTLGRQSTG